MVVDVRTVGRTQGHAGQPPTAVDWCTIATGQLTVRVSTLGATLVGVDVADGAVPLVLGYRDPSAYDDPTAVRYVGATVGRYANRIAGGRFRLDGVEHRIAANEGAHTLHGGPVGFDRYVWRLDAATAEAGDAYSVTFVHVSPDGDEGFPGRLEAWATYRVESDTLTVVYEAVADAPTVVSLANHAYWNLAGADRPGATILDHECTLHASRYLPVDAEKIPTGELCAVDGTPFDFRPAVAADRRRIGARLGDVDGGYDHCFVVDGPPGTLRPAAVLRDPVSGRTLEVATSAPGLQLYPGTHLGPPFGPHAGVALEAQQLPNAPNEPGFPSPILRPGDRYRSTTTYRCATT